MLFYCMIIKANFFHSLLSKIKGLSVCPNLHQTSRVTLKSVLNDGGEKWIRLTRGVRLWVGHLSRSDKMKHQVFTGWEGSWSRGRKFAVVRVGSSRRNQQGGAGRGQVGIHFVRRVYPHFGLESTRAELTTRDCELGKITLLYTWTSSP